MPDPNPPTLDAAIDAALGNEPLRPVPPDFAQRTTYRLYVAALIQREYHQFRTGLAMTALALSATTLCAALFVILADVPGLIQHGVPGGLGLLDYVTAYLAFSWADPGHAVGVMFTPLIASALLLTLWPLARLAIRRNPRSHAP